MKNIVDDDIATHIHIQNMKYKKYEPKKKIEITDPEIPYADVVEQRVQQINDRLIESYSQVQNKSNQDQNLIYKILTSVFMKEIFGLIGWVILIITYFIIISIT